jgi:branched-chain amino acid transport system substrate-binding protein
MKWKRRHSWITVVGALVVGVSAVAVPATGAGASTSKAPIVVGGIAQGSSYPGLADGFNARIARFNKAGGVEGRKVKFIGVQDDGGDPSRDQTLTQALVQEQHVDVVAPVVSEVFNPSATTFLTQQKTPFLGWGLAPDWCNAPYAFSVDGCLILTDGKVSLATGGALAKYLAPKKPSQTTVAIVNGDIPTAAASGAYEAQLFESVGMKVVFNKGIVPIAGTSINYTPYVQQIEASNPDVVFLSLDFASAVGLSSAFVAAGLKTILYSPVGYSEGILETQPSVKAALQGQVVNSEMPTAEDNSPSIKLLSSDLKAIGKAQPVGLGASLGYYIGDMLVQMLQNAAKKGAPLTGAGITQAANSGFTYQQLLKGGACSQTFPAAHKDGTVGLTLMLVSGSKYLVKVPYACYPNVAVKSSTSASG